ncbi:MAG TPA: GNAT family protein [Thermoanaerobaculia bacterium]|nr:GNAT family protein [Thermoanaerobaculia bacterium]
MVQELQDRDVEAYVQLRRQALLDSPLAFAAAPGDDFVSSPDRVRQQLRTGAAWVIFGAFRPDLVGAVGLFRGRYPKASHKAHLWGMYVEPGHRGQGIGAELLGAVIRHARELPGVTWVHLGVTSAASEARRLYERAGFQVWGTEPDALRHEGRTVDEHHMALRLD